MSPGGWYTYLLVSEVNGRTYVGVTTDLERRLRQHNGELAGGARATRAHRPWRLEGHAGPHADRAAAQREERRVKRAKGLARAAAIAAS